jgi:4-hydroxy-tetrahydrodipicolinate synthase
MDMTLISATTKGVFVIAVTPFTDDGSSDEQSLDKVIDFYFDAGADGLTVLGVMGEAPKLTHRESVGIARRAIDRAGGRPVVVGVSSPGLAALGELTQEVMDLGAAGVMVAPPRTVSTDDQIIGYYRNVVATIGENVPVVLQDFPLTTGVQISTRALGAILVELPSIVMLKHEDWPGLQKISDLRAAEAAGRRRTSILCGNAGVFLPEEIERGADGAMTGFAYPEMMVEVCRLAAAGEHERAHDVYDAYLPLVCYEQQPQLGLAVRKYVLKQRGVIASSAQRRPGPTLDARAVADVDRLIARQTRKLEALR